MYWQVIYKDDMLIILTLDSNIYMLGLLAKYLIRKMKDLGSLQQCLLPQASFRKVRRKPDFSCYNLSNKNVFYICA